MPAFLVGSAYAVSSGLIVYGISEDIIDEGSHSAVLIGWAVAGLVLAFIAVLAAAIRPSPGKGGGSEG